MNPTTTIKQLQASLGVPQTGIIDAATTTAMNGAVASALKTNPSVQSLAGTNDPTAILNAYMTGDWSGVVSLSGKPFTDDQQKAAVDQATQALAPAYEAQKAYDTATVTDTLKQDQEGLADTEAAAAKQFGQDKNTLDQNAADNGVLFAGSRLQKQNDLRTSYADKDALARRQEAENATATARGYQYDYGNGAAADLNALYSVPGAPSYNAGVAGGKVTPSSSLSTIYNPGTYNFQGTKPVAQQTAVQTRAASLLANKANKLTLSGVGAKF